MKAQSGMTAARAALLAPPSSIDVAVGVDVAGFRMFRFQPIRSRFEVQLQQYAQIELVANVEDLVNFVEFKLVRPAMVPIPH